jgi:hypothetical protein
VQEVRAESFTAKATTNMQNKLLIITFFIQLCFHAVLGAKAADNSLAATTDSVNKSNSLPYRFDSEYADMIASWDRGAETNGLSCAIHHSSPQGHTPLLLYINVINATTNWERYMGCRLEGLAQIAMYDDSGRAVGKTSKGQTFGFWTSDRIRSWLKEPLKSVNSVVAPFSAGDVGPPLNIAEAFRLERPGVYSLHLRLVLLKVHESQTGEFTRHGVNFDVSRTFLPEVVSKINVRPENLLTEEPTLNDHTNSRPR